MGGAAATGVRSAFAIDVTRIDRGYCSALPTPKQQDQTSPQARVPSADANPQRAQDDQPQASSRCTPDQCRLASPPGRSPTEPPSPVPTFGAERILRGPHRVTEGAGWARPSVTGNEIFTRGIIDPARGWYGRSVSRGNRWLEDSIGTSLHFPFCGGRYALKPGVRPQGSAEESLRTSRAS